MAEEVNDWQPVGDNWKPPKEPDDWQPVSPRKGEQSDADVGLEQSDADVGLPDDWQPVQEQGFFSRMWERGRIDPNTVPSGFMPAELRAAPFYRDIANAFGAGWHEGFGEDRLGLSEDSLKWLREHEWFRNPGQRGFDSWKAPYQAMTELFMGSGAELFDLASRTTSGLFRGGQEAVSTALGGGRFGREVAAIPEAFQGVFGELAEDL